MDIDRHRGNQHIVDVMSMSVLDRESEEVLPFSFPRTERLARCEQNAQMLSKLHDKGIIGLEDGINKVIYIPKFHLLCFYL
jgi:predicted transcriptional regulator YheO